jgi:glycosyltransferase involved in cell wall biosynthesis
MKKSMNIAYLTICFDPYDKVTWRSWSGTVYYVAQTLQKHWGEVTYFDPIFPCRRQKKIERIMIRSSQLLLKKQYTCNFFLANSYAKAGARWLAKQSVDVILALAGATEVAFLETEIPIVLVEDATSKQLIGYYPEYSNLLQRSIYEMNIIQDLALKKASAVIYSSAWAARSAIEDYGADPKKIHVVPFGANLDEPLSREIALARQKSEHCRLLFLGIDWVRKGGDIAFETLLKLEELGVQAELIVCGCTPPKGVVHERMKVIPFLDKNDEKQRKELDKLFMSADFLLVPTRAEAYGLVFCEAAAFGLPVIATNTGGVSEIVREGENGYLLPYEARGEAYAEVIARVYHDDERYSELVQASRAAYEGRLNWDTWGIAVKNILADLLDHENSYKKIDQTLVQFSKLN